MPMPHTTTPRHPMVTARCTMCGTQYRVPKSSPLKQLPCKKKTGIFSRCGGSLEYI